MLLIVLRAIMSWFPLNPYGLPGKFYSLILRGTDPLMRPIQRFVPVLRAGSVGIDFSAMILIIVLIVLQNIVC